MDRTPYKKLFKAAAIQLHKEKFAERGLEIAVGVVLDSLCLKVYKKSWANPAIDPVVSASRIFFSVWVNESSIANQRICYNIHALKLRQLKGYKIQSRQFAEVFRASFKSFEANWPNVSVDFGPQTLMEGWVNFEGDNIEPKVAKLANDFLEIENLIDTTLAKFEVQVAMV
jgi:hypothetical protein